MRKAFILFIIYSLITINCFAMSQATNDNNDKPQNYFMKAGMEYLNENNNRSIYYLDKAIEVNPKHAKAYLMRGTIRLRLNHYTLAITDFSLAIKHNYDNKAVAYIGRGRAKMELGRNTDAIADFTKALSFNPNDIDALYYRAGARGNNGDFYGVIDDCNKILSLNQSIGEVYMQRGIAYYKTDRKDKSLKDFKKASSLGVKMADDIIITRF